MKSKGNIALIIVLIVVIIDTAVGVAMSTGDPGKPALDGDLPVGTYQIVTVVEIEEDYALVVLRCEGGEPRYYRLEKGNVVNFEDILVATSLVKVLYDNTRYIELIK